MFRRLKEKISEEVKQSPLAQYSPFKDDSSKTSTQDMEASTSKQDPKNLIDLRDNGALGRPETVQTDENKSFSIGDDDGLCSEPTSPTPPVPMFENVDLSDNPAVSHRRRRTSSVSSSSSLFPAYSPSSLNHNIQSDLESASEVDDSAVNLEVVSKEQLFSAFQKAKSRYLKYKTRYCDVVKAYRDQVNENGKVKTILTESQDKALRRISELKEQSQLDQKAKFDLEENFRLVLEEKDEVVRVLQTQIRLLKSGVNPFDENGSASGSSTNLDEDVENKNTEDASVVEPDPLTRLRLKEDTINKLKNLLKSCKETITKEKENSAQLNAEKERLATRLEETETKLNTILDDQLSKEQSFDDELKRAAEKMDLFKQKEEENALNLAESKRLMHEEMETREKSLQELKLQLQHLNSEKEALESNLQEKSKLILELEETKYDNLDKSKQQLIETEEALEEEKHNLLQEMSRGKAAALQLLREETEKKISEIQKEKLDSDLSWQEKFETLKAEYDEKIASERSESERNLVEATESKDKYLSENQKLKEILVLNNERIRSIVNRINEFKAANNELSLDFAIMNENQVAELKELRQELLTRIGNVWSSESKEIERAKAEIDELKIDLQSLNDEVTRLTELRENSEREIEALKKQKASLCENNSEFQRVIEELSDTKQSLEERLEVATNLASDVKNAEEEMKNQLEVFREENFALKEEKSKLQQENEDLKTENEALGAEKSVLDSEIANMATLRAELESKDDDNLSKLRRIEGEAAQRLDEVCSENERVSSELRHALEAEQNKVAELNSLLEATKHDNDARLLEVNQRLALELDNMRNATECLKCEVDATREQLIASRSEYTEHISHLSEQINEKENQLREVLGADSTSRLDVMKLKSFDVLREKLRDVRNQLKEDRKTMITNRSEFSDMIETFKGVFRAEKEKSDKLEQNYKEEIVALKTRHDVVNNRVTELELSIEEATKLRQRLEDVENSYDEKCKNYENEILNKTVEIEKVVEIKEELNRFRIMLLQKDEEVTSLSETAKELQQQLDTLRTEKVKLEEELLETKEVSKDVEELKQQLDILQTEKVRLEEELLETKEVSKDVEELRQQLDTLKTEKDQLEKELLETKEVSKDVEELKQQLDILQTEKVQLEEELLETKEASKDVEVLNQQVEVLRTEKENLQLELLATMEKVSKGSEELKTYQILLLNKEEEVTYSMDTLKELKQQVNTLRNENESVKQELSDTKELSNDIEELNKQLDTLRIEKENLQLELSTTTEDMWSQVENFQKKVGNLTHENDYLHEELMKSREEASKGSEELEKCRKLLSEKEEEVTNSIETATELRNENESLKQEVSYVKELKNDVEELQQQVAIFRLEKEHVQEELSESREEVTKVAEELKQELGTCRKLLLEKEMEITMCTETTKELKQQVNTLRTENESLKQELSDTKELSKGLEVLRQQLNTLITENESLKQELSGTKEVSKDVEELKKQLNILRTEKENLELELSNTKEVSKGVFEEVEVYKNDTKQLKQQINILRTENERLESDDKDRKTELENLKKLHKEKLNELNQKFKTKMKNVTGKSTEKILSLEAKVEELKELETQLNEANANLESKVEALKATITSNEHLKKDYELETTKREELDVRVRDMTETLAAVSATSLEKEDAIASLERRLEELWSSLRAKEKEAEELKEQKKQLEETVTRINEENQEKLNDLKKRAENKLAQIKKQIQFESDGMRQQNVEESKSVEVRIREEHKIETERLTSRCRDLESEKEKLLNELSEKNDQIDESLITAQVNHTESTKRLRALESELNESKIVVDDLRNRLSVTEKEKLVLMKQLDEVHGGKEEEEVEDGTDLRVSLQREYERMREALVDEHAAKIKQLTKEFSEMIAKKEEEGREALANAVEQSLNDDNRIRRDHAKQIENIGREMSEREGNLEVELELREKRIKDLESELESTVRNFEGKLSSVEAEQRQQTEAIEKKWKSLMKRELEEREEAYRDEIEGLSEEWKMERKFAVNSNSVELNSQELQKQTKLATSVVESGGYSNELLRRQVMTMQKQLQMLKDKHTDEVEQLKEALRSRNCPIPHFDESRYVSNVLDQRLESLETEYLKNILFEYMMGRETLTLAKVIAAVVRFSDEQTNKVLEREEAKSSGVSGQGQKRKYEEESESKTGDPQQSATGYAEIIKDNEKFVTFYQAQKIVPDGQWDDFMAALRQNLPTTFRITGYKSEAKALLRIIESEYFAKLADLTIDGERIDDPFPLPWYPDRLGWQMNFSRKAIRKTEALERLHNFLISETECGNINRQEAVSMIPPLLLDVRPEHKVLDMCAAPGSKTAQLIEMLHVDDRTVPEGVIVANDIDNKRCYMLVHQAKRLQSSCLLITNHDSGSMPNISMSDGRQLKFDRILCDAPCSGDGTLRKNIDIWVKWNIANCLNFHGIQSRILKRGLELLAIGGLLVYSTCSLCPLEDESVIHHILSLCNDSVELVDVSEKLPGLKFVPGLSYWKVMNRDLEEFRSYDDVPEKFRSQIKGHMFPPKPEVASKYNLHRCLRILPHLQNTGGFFVAVLRKVSALPWETKQNGEDEVKEGLKSDLANDSTTADEPKRDNGSSSPKGKRDSGYRSLPSKQKRISGYREDPFIYLKSDDLLYPSIRDAYKIDESFDSTLLLTRCLKGKRKTIYFTSRAVKEIVTSNEDKLKVINTGIRLFCRCDSKRSSPTEFRVTQEGLMTILPYLQERVVKITKEDAISLLGSSFPDLNKLDKTTLQQLEKYVNGSLVLVLEEEVDSCSEKRLIPLCAWKGASTLRAYVPKCDKLHYLRLCGVDTLKYERKKFQTNAETLKEADEPAIKKENMEDDSLVQDGEGEDQ